MRSFHYWFGFLLLLSTALPQGLQAQNTVWSYGLEAEAVYDLFADGTGATWVLSRKSADSLRVVQLDATGQLTWERSLAGTESSAMIADGNGGAYISTASELGYHFWLYRLDANGVVIGFWEQLDYFAKDFQFAKLSDETLVLLGHQAGSPTSYLKLFYFPINDPSLGVSFLSNTSGQNQFRSLTALNDSSFILTGGDAAPSLQNYYQVAYQIDPLGVGFSELQWLQQYNDLGMNTNGPFIGASQVKNGSEMFALAANHITRLSTEGDWLQDIPLGADAVTLYDDTDSTFVLYQQGTTANQSLISCWENGSLVAMQAVEDMSARNLTRIDNDWLLIGQNADLADNQWIIRRELQQLDTLIGFLSGSIWHDTTANCTLDTGEYLLSERIVRATRQSDGWVLAAMTDNLGQYQMALDTGTWQLVAEPINWYWGFCQDTQTVIISGVDTVQADFAAQIVLLCPLVEVELGTPLLRRCFENTYYIEYQNNGSAVAVEAYIDLEIDPYLSIISATSGYAVQTPQVYRFQLGDVTPGESGEIQVVLYLDCDSTIVGQTHCVTATVWPDTLCVPTSTDWTGAKIEASAECVGDSAVHLKLHNVSDVDMVSEPQFIIIEDLIIMMQEPYSIPAKDSIKIIRPATGQTIRIKGKQDPGYPENSQPTVAVEGCGALETDSIHLGFVLAFPEDNQPVHYERLCMESIGSFDPNDKTGFPRGVGADGFIEPGTQLTYQIRFQNTGTDTAFTVVVRDTLSPWLDLSTLQLGTESHDYQVVIEDNRVLVFTFNNIMLPDSNVNEAGSHGFFRYSIKHLPSAPLGTLIENTAHIYFDFNEAVVTNTTRHTLAKNFLDVASPTSDFQSESGLKIWPQPFADCTTVSWPQSGQGTLVVFDYLGRAVLHQAVSGRETQLCLSMLPAGLYTVQVSMDDKQWSKRLQVIDN
jgi:uncharacterized repeat protein (TIGR01451 family)